MVLLAASNASAATLDVVGGQLLGASGVIVDGSSYNVEFLDGTCIDLYSGCDALEAPDLVTAASRVPNGVICLISALAFHDLTTQVPHAVDIAVAPGGSL